MVPGILDIFILENSNPYLEFLERCSTKASKLSFVAKWNGVTLSFEVHSAVGLATLEPRINLCPQQMRKMKGNITHPVASTRLLKQNATGTSDTVTTKFIAMRGKANL